MPAAPLLLTLSLTIAAPALPPGFEAQVVAEGPALSFVTSIAFDGDGVLFAGEADIFRGQGRVLRLPDRDGDGRADAIEEHATGFGLVIGLAFRPPRPPRGPASVRSSTPLEAIRLGAHRGETLDLFVSHYRPAVAGAITRLADRDRDGRAEERQDVVTGLPSDGLSGNQQIAIGLDRNLYFAQGARTNAGVPSGGPPDGPLNATILRAGADGSGLAVFARGLRNSYDLAFTSAGELFATENGPDASGPTPIVAAPDELNVILEGQDYGWPNHFGAPAEGSGTLGPLVQFNPSTSSDGIALVTPPGFCGYAGDFLVAQFGSYVDPAIGRKVVRVAMVGRRSARVEDFATGFGRPLDLAFAPDGSLYVAEFSNVALAPRTAVIWRIRPVDADGDGRPDLCAP